MMRRRGRLWCLVCVIALAAPGAPAQAADGGWAGLGPVWAWLEPWLPWAVETADQCASIDPDGRCRGGLAAATSDQGSSIDPDGGSSATSDQGSSIDPNG
jgi:hypothetical protein